MKISKVKNFFVSSVSGTSTYINDLFCLDGNNVYLSQMSCVYHINVVTSEIVKVYKYGNSGYVCFGVDRIRNLLFVGNGRVIDVFSLCEFEKTPQSQELVLPFFKSIRKIKILHVLVRPVSCKRIVVDPIKKLLFLISGNEFHYCDDYVANEEPEFHTLHTATETSKCLCVLKKENTICFGGGDFYGSDFTLKIMNYKTLKKTICEEKHARPIRCVISFFHKKRGEELIISGCSGKTFCVWCVDGSLVFKYAKCTEMCSSLLYVNNESGFIYVGNWGGLYSFSLESFDDKNRVYMTEVERDERTSTTHAGHAIWSSGNRFACCQGTDYVRVYEVSGIERELTDELAILRSFDGFEDEKERREYFMEIENLEIIQSYLIAFEILGKVSFPCPRVFLML